MIPAELVEYFHDLRDLVYYFPLQRFSFLSGYACRTKEEEREVYRLEEMLRSVGIDTGWEIVPRSTREECWSTFAVGRDALHMLDRSDKK